MFDPIGMQTPYKRRWWSYTRFSSRGLIVLVLVVGIWLGRMVRIAQIQRDAVSGIRQAGGLVVYSRQMRRGNLATAWPPKWLLDRLGIDHFDHVDYVSLRGRVSDAEMIHVKQLTQLHYLYLVQTEVSDAQLVNIEGMISLRELNISETKVGDAGLVHLKRLTGLQSLFLDHTMVTDAGLAHLKGLSNLELASFLGTSVTDFGAKRLHDALPRLPRELIQIDRR